MSLSKDDAHVALSPLEGSAYGSQRRNAIFLLAGSGESTLDSSMMSRIAPFAAAGSVLALLGWVALAGRPGPAGEPAPTPQAAPAPAGPCEEPLGWRIGQVDPRFDLEPAELQAAVEEAASVWEEGVGRPLFVFDPEDGFPVHAIYDAAQARLEHRERAEAAFREAERRLDALRRELGEDDPSFQRGMEAHRARGEALERTFAPTPVEAGRYLETVHAEDGLLEREIRIHRFGDETDLVWVIAHELGHALGLEHVAEPRALMGEHYGGRGSRPRVGPSELEQLRALCGA
jgi:hypothetical protein